MDRQAIIILVMALVLSTVVWGGFSFYKAQNDVQVNPKAVTKSAIIKGEFDLTTLQNFKEVVESQEYDINELKSVEGDNPKFTPNSGSESTDALDMNQD